MPLGLMRSGIEQLAETLRRSAHTLVLTGAGVSAESGVPTFRDAQAGLWANYRPEDLATPDAFARDPATVWRWYAERRAQLATVQPNPAHFALARLQTILSLTLVTQNVDGLHQRAGSDAVIEFHGNITRTICTSPSCCGSMAPGDLREPPVCPVCGAFLRPAVVWFGEPIPERALGQASAAAGNCAVFIAVGTSAVVYPAAGLADRAAACGAVIAEINPQTTALSPAADIMVQGLAGEVLPAVADQLGC